MNNFFVYALVDPINRVPFYIGKGKGNRPYAHLKGYANYNQKKLNYISAIRNLGFEPLVYKIIENLSSNESLEYEKIYIKMYIDYITNSMIYPPDRAGCTISEEHRKRLSEFNSGKTLSDSHKRKIGESNTHKPNYDMSIPYNERNYIKNQGSKNPNAKRVRVGDIEFGCMKDAYEYFGVSKSTFNKRYKYEFV